MRLGVFGGTFNPVHNGHLKAAGDVASLMNLDSIILVPTGLPPLKSEGLASADDRLRMVQMAVDGDPRYLVSDKEVRLKGPSYSVITLKELRDEHSADELFFIIGIDAFRDLHLWREPGLLLTLADFIVISRPGCRFSELAGHKYMAADELALGELDSGQRDVYRVGMTGGTHANLIRIDTPDISSSEIRARLARGLSVGQMLPEIVESFIMSNDIYTI